MHLDKAHALTGVCLLLFMGAMGKSAQFLLHTWLPDAMEGPTPVSALIHAATMVTAGVFLVARMSPLFELRRPRSRGGDGIGAITAFFAATVGLVQNDIKRVIAYSTCSQLGYMFVALGIGAYGGASSTCSPTPSSRRCCSLAPARSSMPCPTSRTCASMGGLRKKIPMTYWMMIIGTLALTGVGIPGTLIGTAGFFSKDMHHRKRLCGAQLRRRHRLRVAGDRGAVYLFYSWRLIFMTFHGKPRASSDVMHHAHESPPVMLVPLFILAVGALLAGVVFKDFFFGDHYEAFWGRAVHRSRQPDRRGIPPCSAVGQAEPVRGHAAGPCDRLVLLHPLAGDTEAAGRGASGPLPVPAQQMVLRRALRLHLCPPGEVARLFLWKQGDMAVIDGYGPTALPRGCRTSPAGLSWLQTGYLYHYAFAMLIGIAALVTWMMLGSAF
jgi:NADH-quinone oxidoreductase subunit L